uniref:Uncharacterized protein n=1 Tax=Chromera velia CCMP2878 TaxID=1169474 RepID=A0A0G4FNW9_9ALVE|eukprot:Cvel_17947.t1-p1 / transcript=Cvel_17947.t1 / gene=Cvel_17947 / organism=Chromera_velia_CCMP2878 / gene_product=Kinase D-interacting substrate of 220 kDa, putative / transcript_product=Kinase D-interacting substrate of 220 kDa, putative / location=Cvel_scaffold1459:17177-18664(+) / protein_length=496 / sequence_SO=supercontig / SO=protein_coding / is_pseudo=false
MTLPSAASPSARSSSKSLGTTGPTADPVRTTPPCKEVVESPSGEGSLALPEDSPSSPSRFQLTPMILQNVRRFRPVSAEFLKRMVKCRWSGEAEDEKHERSVNLLLLLRVGADVNGSLDIPSSDVSSWMRPACLLGGPKESILHFAARRGDTVAVSTLLSLGVAVNRSTPGGFTALFAGAAEGHAEAVKILLRAGADARIQSNWGWSALLVASSSGQTAVVREIVSVEKGKGNIAELLEAQGAGFGFEGTTALMVASGRGHLDVVRVLIEAGALVDAVDRRGWTPLHTASFKGNVDVVLELLQCGASVNQGCTGSIGEVNGTSVGWVSGRTPLMAASFKGYTEIVVALIKADADVEAKDHWGETALIRGARQGSTGAVRALLSAGADPNVRTRSLYGGCIALVLAARGGHVEVVRALLESNAGVNNQEKDRRMALEAASERGHVEVVKTMLEAGVTDDPLGQPALEAASREGHTAVVQVLEKGNFPLGHVPRKLSK